MFLISDVVSSDNSPLHDVLALLLIRSSKFLTASKNSKLKA
ncbi:hypothetical protein [Sulfuracidifex metallicus]|nr:hypothetical protein [Sulfuracidifex metallicus]WOE50394.1 hypothetical protein RQ359_001919 [Sulfuracidifex metallicus DSM 6482 = JCM 9184]